MSPKVGGFEEAWNRDGFAPRKFKNRIVDRHILMKNGVDPDQFIWKIRHMSPTRMRLTLVGNLASGFPDTPLHEGLYVGRQACKR